MGPAVATQERRSQIIASVCICLIKSSNTTSCTFLLVKRICFIKHTVKPQSLPAACVQLKPCVFDCCLWPFPAFTSPAHNTAGISRRTLGFLTGYKISVISLLSACSLVALLTVTLHYLIHIAIIISFPVYRNA